MDGMRRFMKSLEVVRSDGIVLVCICIYICIYTNVCVCMVSNSFYRFMNE